MDGLVEREDELSALLEAAGASDGRLVFVAGEAGSGKTALLRAFRDRLDHRHDVRFGRCEPLSTPAPLGALYDMLGTFSDEVGELVRSGDDRARLFAALHSDLSASRSVTIIDDAHYADEATVDLVRYLGRRIGDTPSLLVCAFRPGEIDRTHPLRAVLGELGPSAIRVDLRPLSMAGVRRLASGIEIDPVRVYSATGGNPLFVSQLLAHPGVDLPASLADAVLGLAQSLPSPAWELLDIMSLVPDGLPLQILDELGVGGYVDGATSVGLLELDGGRVRCRHDLIRAALGTNVPAATRLRIHRRVFDALRRDPSTDVSVLAHHAVEAGSADEAIELSLDAAERAIRDGSHREAAAHYANALMFEAHMTEQVRRETRKAFSYELYLTGRLEEAWTEAERTYRQAPDDVERGRALRWMSRLSWFLGTRADAVRHGRDAVRVLENDGNDQHELAYAYSNMAQLAMLSDDRDQTRFWAERALEIARREGDVDVLAHATNNLGTALMKESIDQAVMVEESLEISLRHRMVEHAARAYTNLSYNLLWNRQRSRAAHFLQEGLDFCEAQDVETWWWYMRGIQARMQVDECDWQSAIAAVEAILATRESAIMRHDALVAQARLSLRTGGADGNGAVALATEVGRQIGEPIRLVLSASVAAEAEWMGLSTPAETAWIDDVIQACVERGDRWGAAEILFWRLRSGGLVPDGSYAQPVAAELAGDHVAASAGWIDAGCSLHAEIARAASGSEEDIRIAVERLADLGAVVTIEALRRRLRQQGVVRIPRGPNRQTRANPAGITARQLDVLGCLAKGMTNAEIADDLFISVKTVEHHVSAIITKLGAKSRSQAVAEARERHILD